MRCVLGVVILAFMAGTADAQWFARGDYNGWSLDDPLVDQGGGFYTGTISGLTPGDRYNYKIARDDWSQETPGSDGRVAADSAGEIHYNFWENETWTDGWEPANERRVGYADPGQFGWEIAGDMNGWAGGLTWHLIDQGNGLHSGLFVLAEGNYEFKFREQGDWNVSIGDNFGNSAANAWVEVNSSGLPTLFQLDLPNGRWQAVQIPEPGSAMLFIVGLVGLTACSRRR